MKRRFFLPNYSILLVFLISLVTFSTAIQTFAQDSREKHKGQVKNRENQRWSKNRVIINIDDEYEFDITDMMLGLEGLEGLEGSEGLKGLQGGLQGLESLEGLIGLEGLAGPGRS